MLKNTVVGKCFDDQFNTDTIQIAAGNTYDGFWMTHIFAWVVKVQNFEGIADDKTPAGSILYFSSSGIRQCFHKSNDISYLLF